MEGEVFLLLGEKKIKILINDKMTKDQIMNTIVETVNKSIDCPIEMFKTTENEIRLKLVINREKEKRHA